MNIVRRMSDGLVNMVTGLNVLGQSKAASGTYQWTPRPAHELAAAYRSSWLAKACVDMPVDDALGAGRSWQGDADQINTIEAEERRLGWKAAIRRAKKLARRDGGAAIFIDTGEDVAEPFDATTVGRGRIRKLVVLARRELAAGERETDIEADGYGYPRTWRISSARNQIEVHPSRLVFYHGDPVLDDAGLGAQPEWNDSVLESRLSAIRDAEATISNTAELIYEANVDVVGFPDLMQIMAAGGEDEVLRRVRLMKQGKSVSKVLVTDAAETYERKAVSFGALPELLREMMLVAAGAVQIPASRLLSRSIAGLNSTGDGEERIYFDRCDALRDEVREESEALDEALIRSALGSRPDGLHYIWPSLRQVSDTEKAEITDKIATAWEKIGRTGFFTQDEGRKTLSNTLIEAGVAPGLEEAMEETGEVDFGFTAGEGEEGTEEGAEGAE